MSSTSTKSSSGKEEEIWQGVQELLEEKRYPDTNTIAHGTVSQAQSLKDLIMSSVCMETSGEYLVSAWTAQPGSSKDIILGFQSLVHFLHHDVNEYKTELQQSLFYPLFVYSYLLLLSLNEGESAQTLYSRWSDDINKHCTSSHELKELLSLESKQDLLTSSLAEKFRNNKYISRISDPSFNLLITFMQAHPTTCLMNLIQRHFSLEVFGNTVQVNGEQRQEGKKGPSFLKPRIDPVAELEINLPTYAISRPHPLPPLPQSDMESSSLKSDYQQRLISAAQQLDPSPPSILLCTVHTPRHLVQCSSLSNKSKLYACGLDDSSVRMWSWLPAVTDHVTTDSTSCDSRILRGHGGPVYGLSFSTNGQYLLSSSEDTTVRLWDTNTSTCQVSYQGHCYPVWDVTFSSVDGYFVTSSYDRTARLWSTEFVYPLRIFAGHEESVEVAQFHPNGNYIATGSMDRTCRLWDINTGNCVRLYTGSKQAITALSFSPFGRQLVTASQDGTITLWDLSSTRAIRELKGHTSRVTSLTYSSDGTLLGSCGYDNTINLWNIKSILAPSTSSLSQDLISCLMTGSTLPIHLSFTQRNCLIAIGTSHDSYHDNRTELIKNTKRHKY